MVSERAKTALGDLVANSEPVLKNPECTELKTSSPDYVRVLCSGMLPEGKSQEIGIIFVREGDRWRAIPIYAHSVQVSALLVAEKWDEACAQVDRFMAIAPFGFTNWGTKADCLLRIAAADQTQHKAKLEEARGWVTKVRDAYPDPEDAKDVQYLVDRLAFVEANPPFSRQPLTHQQIKGDASRLVGRTALVYGFVRASDYFNWGYSQQRGTMFSFDLNDINASGEPGFDRLHVYAEKEKFRDFFDKVSSSSEPKLATLVITLPGERYDKHSSTEFTIVAAKLGRAVDLNPDWAGRLVTGNASKSWSAKFKMAGARGDQPVTGRLHAFGQRLRIEVDGFKFVQIVDLAEQTTWSFDPTAASSALVVWDSPTADIGMIKQSFKCAERRDECFTGATLTAKGSEAIDGVECDVLENTKSDVFQKPWKRVVTQTVWRPRGPPAVPFLRVRTGWIETNLSEIEVGREQGESFIIPDGARVLRGSALVNLRDEDFPEFEKLRASGAEWMNVVLKSALPPP